MLALIENALDAVVTINAAGVIIGWNAQAKQLFGWSRREALGLKLSDTIIPARYHRAYEHGIRHYLATGEGPMLNKRTEVVARHQQGHEVPVEMVVSALKIGDEVIFSAFLRDIGPLMQADQSRQENQARISAILETAAEAIITIDKHGIIETFNPAAAQIFGYQAEEVIGRNVSLLMPEPHHSQHNHYLTAYLTTQQSKIIGTGRELEGRRKDGTIFPIHLAVSEVKLSDRRIFTGIIRDITALREAEAALQQLNQSLEQRVTERTAEIAQINTELVREVAERKQAEQQYRSIFEHAPAMYVISEGSHGEPLIKDCNHLFVSTLGYTLEEVLGQPVAHFYHPASKKDLFENGGYQRVLNGQSLISERKLVRKDGHIIDTILQAIPEFDADGQITGTRAMFIDISERKQIEAAEREQRELAESLRQAAAVISASLDFETVLNHLLEQIGRVIPYNAANLMLVEDELARLVRRRGYEQFGPTVDQAIRDLSLNIAQTPHLHYMMENEQPLIIADTTIKPRWQPDIIAAHCRSWAAVPVCIHGQTVAFLMLDKIEPDFFQTKDIEHLAAFANHTAVAIENVQLYQAKQQQVKELSVLNAINQVANSSLDWYEVLTAITDHTVRLFNSEAAWLILKDRITNEPEFVAISGPKADFFSDSLPALAEIPARYLTLSRPVIFPDSRTEACFFDHNNQINGHTIRSMLSVPLQIKGQTIGAITVINKQDGLFNPADLQLLGSIAPPIATAIENAQLYKRLQQHATELEQHVSQRTAELSQTNAELARSVRLKDEFLANMSHELRTPLNAVLGMSEALQEQTFGSLNEEQLDALSLIEESGRHLLTLINDILDLSKIEAGMLELQIDPVSVETVAQACLRLIKQTAHSKRLKVLFTLDELVPTVQADERYLKQILVNLLSNAVKFTPEGGRIGLEIMSEAAQNAVRITVWDTGIGISAEDIERLFQPFVQLDSRLARRYSGTGLGLALVYRMVELHGGSVSVESEVGQGSRFTITLPASDVESEATEPAETIIERERLPTTPATLTNAAQPPLKQPLILLAEDNESNIKTLYGYLSRNGFRVEVARNGREALAQAGTVQPNLILMDIQMPEMDGLEAIRRLRADPALNKVPIIALTALAMADDRSRCLAAGANEYLAKPIHLKNLISMIKRYL